MQAYRAYSYSGKDPAMTQLVMQHAQLIAEYNTEIEQMDRKLAEIQNRINAVMVVLREYGYEPTPTEAS